MVGAAPARAPAAAPYHAHNAQTGAAAPVRPRPLAHADGARAGRWGDELKQLRAAGAGADSSGRTGKYGGTRYHPCKSFVYAPTWAPDALRGAAAGGEPPDAEPDARLELEWVYGYTAGRAGGAPSSEAGMHMGSDQQDNVRWLSPREIVFTAAAVSPLLPLPPPPSLPY